MPRPKLEHPTPGELEVLKVLWDEGPATVREVHDAFAAARRKRAYTSVMSLMNVMVDKGLLKRKPQGRAYLYEPRVQRGTALGKMVDDLCERAFEGSASLLVSQLLERSSPDRDELDEIRRVIDLYREQNSEGRPS